MKKFLAGLVLDAIFDALIKVFENFAKRSASKIDDKMVAVLVEEQEALKADILRKL